MTSYDNYQRDDELHPQTTSNASLRFPRSMFEQFLSQSTVQEEHAAERRQLRRRCGCWVALRRLQLGLTAETIWAQTGLDPDRLHLLELGLAEAAAGNAGSWEALSSLLAAEQPQPIAAAIVAGALGHFDPAPPGLLGALADLEALTAASTAAPAEQAPELAVVSEQQSTLAPESLSPLPTTDLLILLILIDRQASGHSLMQAIAQQSNGALQVGPAVLYRTLQRLLTNKLIEQVPDVGDRPLDTMSQRHYRMTHFGREVAKAEVGRRTRAVRQAQREQREVSEPLWLQRSLVDAVLRFLTVYRRV